MQRTPVRDLPCPWPGLHLSLHRVSASDRQCVLNGCRHRQWLTRKRPEIWRHRATAPCLCVLSNTPRTPSPGFGGSARSARLGPSRRRRGSRRCDTPRAAAGRRCNPALLDECRLRPGAAGAPARHQGSAPSAGGANASYRAFRPLRRRGSSSRRSMCRTGPAPRLRAPRMRGSLAECSPLSGFPRPSLSVSSSRTPGQPGWL